MAALDREVLNPKRLNSCRPESNVAAGLPLLHCQRNCGTVYVMRQTMPPTVHDTRRMNPSVTLAEPSTALCAFQLLLPLSSEISQYGRRAGEKMVTYCTVEIR